jgi:hypothetical protein
MPNPTNGDDQPACPNRDDGIHLAQTLTIDELRELLASAVSSEAQDELADLLMSGRQSISQG